MKPSEWIEQKTEAYVQELRRQLKEERASGESLPAPTFESCRVLAIIAYLDSEHEHPSASQVPDDAKRIERAIGSLDQRVSSAEFATGQLAKEVERLSDDLVEDADEQEMERGIPMRPIAQVKQVIGNDIHLLDPNDVVCMWDGLRVVASAWDGSESSHTLRDSGKSSTIVGVDFKAGVVTVDEPIPTLAAHDYLFPEMLHA